MEPKEHKHKKKKRKKKGGEWEIDESSGHPVHEKYTQPEPIKK